jgi:catechol 2,3-dioxygenase-like lactoylglutathione lyase family enzyme
MRIGVTEVFVDDQDKARAFYTEILGFEVKADTPYSDTARWLTVVSPEDLTARSSCSLRCTLLPRHYNSPVGKRVHPLSHSRPPIVTVRIKR